MSFKPFKRVYVGSNDSNFSVLGLPKLIYGKEYEIDSDLALQAGIYSEDQFDLQMTGTMYDKDGKAISVFAKPASALAREAVRAYELEQKKKEQEEKKVVAADEAAKKEEAASIKASSREG